MNFFKTLTTLFFLNIVLLLSSGCSKEECQENVKADCVCTALYDPVCGCNNKTYGNACEAGCAGITEFTNGACFK